MTEYIMDRYYNILSGKFETDKREKIVRCRDCEHYDDYTGCCTRRDNVAPMASTPNKFCAWGERRSE